MSERAGRAPRLPDGIDLERRESLWDRFATAAALLILGGILLAAAFGLAGGQPSPVERAGFGPATLQVKTPLVIRNGEFFETRIEVSSSTGLEDAVIAVDAELWRDMTINTMIPAPAEEEYKDGAFRFSFGRLEPGDTLELKIDGQINPPLFAGTRGAVSLYDGDKLIGRKPLGVKVLP